MTTKSNESATFTVPVPAKRDTPLPEVNAYVVDNESSVQAEIVNVITTRVDVNNDVNNDVSKEKMSTELINPDSQAKLDSEIVLNTLEPKKHFVLKGESLYAISVKYNIKISALRQWNKMSTKQKLYVGKEIYVENPEAINNND
jgi:type IV pilus assembly protein PilF